MPLIAQIPRNQYFIKKYGSYRRYINILSRKETAVQRHIRRGGLGSYESAFQSALFALCEQPSNQNVFYDIGAHIGIYSLLLGTVFRNSPLSIFAFEPTPRTAELCRVARDANNLNFSIMQTAVGCDSGEIDFYLSTKTESSNSMNSDFRPGSEKISVPLTTIDRVVASGIPYPSIMKVDVETLEPDVLVGSRKTISQFKPIITCEFLPRKDTRDSIGELLSWLTYYGYIFYRITSEGEFKQYDSLKALDSFDSEERDWILSPTPLTKAHRTE